MTTSPLDAQLRDLEQQLEDERQARRAAEASQHAQARALDQSESRYRMLIESASDIIYKADYQGRLVYANPIATRKLGYTLDEIRGRHFAEFIHPEYRQRLAEYYLDVFRNRREANYTEFPIVTRWGDEIWIGQNVWLVLDPTNPALILEVNAVARDITDRRRAELATRTAQSRLAALVGSLHAGVLTVDEHRRVVIANAAFCRIFGFTCPSEELLGRHATGLLFEYRQQFVDFEGFMKCISEHFVSQRAINDLDVRMRSGQILSMDYVPIFSGEEFMGHLWRFRDITKLFNAQEQLRRSEEKYRSIMENMELGFLEVDNQGTIVRAYERFCQMTGYTEAELVGQPDAILLTPDYREIVRQQSTRRISGETSTYEVQVVRKDGRLIWVLVSGGPVIDETR